jgi:hypothetical protein
MKRLSLKKVAILMQITYCKRLTQAADQSIALKFP